MIYTLSSKKTMKNFQAKNQSIEVKDLVTFIAEQTEEEVKQVQMLNKQLETLKTETDTQKAKIAELEKKIAELEALRKTQEQTITDLNAQVKQVQEQQTQQREFLCLVSM